MPGMGGLSWVRETPSPLPGRPGRTHVFHGFRGAGYSVAPPVATSCGPAGAEWSRAPAKPGLCRVVTHPGQGRGYIGLHFLDVLFVEDFLDGDAFDEAAGFLVEGGAFGCGVRGARTRSVREGLPGALPGFCWGGFTVLRYTAVP